MISIGHNIKIFLRSGATDLRKSFNGLTGVVRNELGSDPADGSLFLFVNRRQDSIKALYWDRDGLAIWYKRLESGSFEMLQAKEGEAAVQIDQTQLQMILGGVSLKSAKRRKRYEAA
jgi:transposase